MKSIYEFLLKSKTAVSTQDTDYVDFGLPSGLLWATCNIGAYEPYEYGDYFMWGSTEPDTDKSCDWKTCPFNGGDNDFNEEYFKSIQDDVCPNGTLAPEYDVVRAIMGGNWRMPTYDDFNELLNNTTNTWVTNYQNSSINGRLFTSKADDSKTLFIPASGYRGGHSFGARGSLMYLWSSSLYTSSPNCVRYLSGIASSCRIYYFDRCYGFCLRGVTK